MTNQQQSVLDDAVRIGTRDCGSYRFTVDRPVVKVQDLRTGMLVAYSCLKSYYDESLDEFVRWYA